MISWSSPFLLRKGIFFFFLSSLLTWICFPVKTHVDLFELFHIFKKEKSITYLPNNILLEINLLLLHWFLSTDFWGSQNTFTYTISFVLYYINHCCANKMILKKISPDSYAWQSLWHKDSTREKFGLPMIYVMNHAADVGSEMSSLYSRSSRFPPRLSSRSFIVLCFTFKSVDYFELIFLKDVWSRLKFIFCMWMFRCSKTICWK